MGLNDGPRCRWVMSNFVEFELRAPAPDRDLHDRNFPRKTHKMKQNIYDSPQFFAGYERLPRSVYGPGVAMEWPVLRAMLPPLGGLRVLDMGCGFGYHCRWMREQGAASVLGVDLSEKMLERASAMTSDPAIEYRRSAIEDLKLAAGSFDLVTSSLTLHYVSDFGAACALVAEWLVASGHLVFSVEHPIYTALDAQDWCADEKGARRHWPVDGYRDEGIRHVRWFVDDVIKYHRTIETWVNTLIDHGLAIRKIAEPEPPAELIREHPELSDERRRPPFLLIAAQKM